MDPSTILNLPPDQLYALYLKVWGNHTPQELATILGTDPATAQEIASSVFYAMGNYGAAGIFELRAEDNKYYPAGQAPANYTAVPDPSGSGGVIYVPTGPSTAVTPGTGGPLPPTPAPGILAGLSTAQIVLYGVLGYLALKALGVIR